MNAKDSASGPWGPNAKDSVSGPGRPSDRIQGADPIQGADSAPSEKPADYNPSRRKARRRALDALYSADLRGASASALLSDTIARMGRDVPAHMGYATELVEGVAAHAARIDELLSTYAEGWTLDRMPVIDRNLGRIAVYEALFRDDIDDAVAISEAVTLAEELSTDESPRFLNGLLSRITDHT